MTVQAFFFRPISVINVVSVFLGECKSYIKDYIKCLKENKNNNGLCRQFSKAYLQCRMDNGLMDKDDMNNLGFADLNQDTERK
ncbi:unnamed protein product [Rhizopus stolonifer]